MQVHELSLTLSVSPPSRKNVHGALANVHEWSPSLLSSSPFIEPCDNLVGASVASLHIAYVCLMFDVWWILHLP